MEGLVIGRIVHYVSRDFDEYPGIIVKVCLNSNDFGIVNLQVFADKGTSFTPHVGEDAVNWVRTVPYSEEKVNHSWHWIEREQKHE